MSLTLDVGCGRRKRASIGIDFSRDSDADVIADAHHLPFKAGIFDKVISVTVLEHSPNPLLFLEEQYRILKPGGKIVLVTDNAPFYRWSILRFRGIKHIMIEDFKTINLFVGRNNCGKSTVLEAIFLLTGPTNAELPLKINAFRKLKIIDENIFKLFKYN